MKPADFTLFDGGLTDKNIPGVTNRHATVDNVLIDGDKKLYSRDGFDIFSSTAYQLAAAERVARLVSFNADSELLAFQNKKANIVDANGAWAEVTGPNSLSAFPWNGAASLVEVDQWNKHLYATTSTPAFTGTVTIASPGVWTAAAHGLPNGTSVILSTTGSLPTGLAVGTTYYVVSTATNTFQLSATSGGSAINTSGSQSGVHTILATNSPPIKMYRDAVGTMQLRTAGLPAFGAYTAGVADLTPADGGLALAISLANDLRTQMIAHYGSNGAQGTKSVTGTVTIASPGVWTAAAHGLTNGTRVTFATTGALPTGITAGTTYYVVNVATDTFEFSATSGGASINTSGSQSGVHTITAAGIANNSSTGAHYADAELASQASAVTASTAATNLASLITLVGILRAQYALHIADAGKFFFDSGAGDFTRKYHLKLVPAYYRHYPYSTTLNQPSYSVVSMLNFYPEEDSTIPSTAPISVVLEVLNDLRDKWNWHTYSTMSHFNSVHFEGTSYFTQLGLHKTALSRVEPYTWAKITPNHGAFIQYVKDMKTEYDAHRLSDSHMEDDTTNVVNAAYPTTPTTFHEAVTLLGALMTEINFHLEDGNSENAFNDATYAGSSPATAVGNAVINLAGVVTANQLDYKRVVPMNGGTALPSAWALFQLFTGAREALHQISSHTTTNPFAATTGNNFTVARTTEYFLLTNRRYHYGKEAAALYSIYELANDFGELDYSGRTATGLQGVADFAETFAGYLRSHIMGRTTAQTFSIRVGGKKYDTFSLSSATSTAGNDLYLHGYQSSVSGGYLVYPASVWQSSGFEQAHFTDRVPDATSVNYRMCFRYDYAVGAVSFTDRSAPSTPINVIGFAPLSGSEASEKGETAAEFTSIYAHTNTSVQNYAISDTTNWRKEIYRTIDSGQLYYRVDVNEVVGDIQNSTTTFSDYSQDTYLVDQLGLYTNGGIVENDAPPLATALCEFNDTVYYVKGNRLYQSVQGDPDSVPGDFFVQFPEDLIGAAATKSNVVAFSVSTVWRISGARDEFGQGEILKDVIFNRTGAISAASIVRADNGIFFAGKDGFYFTDGYQCMRVTDLEDTFRRYTDSSSKRSRVSGAYDNVSKRVYWTVQTDSGSSPNSIWVLDLQFGIKADSTPITTFSALYGFNPTALAFYGGILHYGDADGYTWKQTLDRAIDLHKDTAVAATSWSAATIVWDVKSCHHDYGTAALRKYYTRVAAQFEQVDTNLSVQINSDADKGRSISALPVIRSRKLATAAGYGDSKFDWIGDLYTTKPGETIDEFRWFKGDGFLRSNFRAVQFTNAYTVIANSTEMGTLTIGNVAGLVWSATLVSLVLTRKWPLYSVDYYLRVSGVDYPVTVRSSDSVIRFDSTGLTSPATGAPASWELWGKPKGERMRLISYTVLYDLNDDQQTDYKGDVTSAGTNV